MNTIDYQNMIKTLCKMDENQLLELYHDMMNFGNLLDVDRIADTAYHFVISYKENKPEQKNIGISDEQDYIAVDNARLAREFA